MDPSIISPRDLRIRCDEDTHIYTVDGKQEYRSVSSILATMFEPFDAEKIAQFLHKRNPSICTSEYVEKIREKGAASREKGKKFHKLIEQIGATEQALDAQIGELRDMHRQWRDWMKKDPPKRIVRAEWMVFDERFKIAGTIDAILRVGDQYWLVDWKTNKSISGETLRQYQLQLRLYHWILVRNYGLHCHRCVLLQVHDDRAKAREIDVTIDGNSNYLVQIIRGQCALKSEEDKVIEAYDV